MEDTAPKIPVALVEVVLNTKHAAGLRMGGETHYPALHLVGEVVPFTQDVPWIREIVAGYLPADYSGDTLDEIPRMVADSLKKGYGAPSTRKGKNEQLSATQVTAMIIGTSEMELFHTPQNECFVAVTRSESGTICLPVRSEAMKAWVRLRYHLATGKTLGREALTEVLDLLEAKAFYTAPMEEAHVRVAGWRNAVYYDLGLPDGSRVKITPSGWTIVQDSHPRFYRPAGFGEQMVPVRGGKLSELRDLLQQDEKNWVLMLAYMLISLKPTHPYMACS